MKGPFVTSFLTSFPRSLVHTHPLPVGSAHGRGFALHPTGLERMGSDKERRTTEVSTERSEKRTEAKKPRK